MVSTFSDSKFTVSASFFQASVTLHCTHKHTHTHTKYIKSVFAQGTYGRNDFTQETGCRLHTWPEKCFSQVDKLFSQLVLQLSLKQQKVTGQESGLAAVLVTKKCVCVEKIVSSSNPWYPFPHWFRFANQMYSSMYCMCCHSQIPKY